MNFEKAYENYKAGTATEEEIAYVEGEIEKAKKLNEIIDALDAKRAIAPSSAEDVQKAKKQHSIKSVVRTIVIAFLCFVVICGAVCGGVFGQAVSSAKANTTVDAAAARTIAEQFVSYNFASTSAVATDVERELEITLNLTHSYYNYYVEVETENGREFDIVVNGKTHIAEIDYYDN